MTKETISLTILCIAWVDNINYRGRQNMYKKLLIALAFAAVFFVSGKSASALVAPQYDSFCHATNSVKNPYIVVPFSSTYSEIDGQGKNDHTLHIGPVATSPAVAQQLKNNKVDWGDIIPPVPGVLPAGYNWDADGQAIYNNGCNYVNPNFDVPLISFAVACDPTNSKYVIVTLTNDGKVDGSAFVNGVEVPVASGQTVTYKVDSGSNVEVVIGKQTVYNQVVTCKTTSTSSVSEATPTSTTKPQVKAPKAGVNAGGGTVIASVVALVGSIGAFAYGLYRLRKTV